MCHLLLTLTDAFCSANIRLMETKEKRATSHESRETINILGIETSCDETAAAVVADGKIVKSSVIASQTKLHEKYGGVVPEIASRAHIEKIYPVIAEAIAQANVVRDDIDAIAVANQPGLTIALIVGVTAAKTLSFAWDKPLIAINHLHAHLQSAMLLEDNPQLPAVALIVSGGHTCLYDYRSPLEPELLGHTIDDAAGEAFDKVATILKLNKVDSMSPQQIADIAASFQAAVVDVLVKKTQRAAEKIGAKTILLGGGVAANNQLRTRLQQMCDSDVPPKKLLVAPKQYCTDNAVMVASLAYYKFKARLFADLTLEPKATG